MEETYWKQFMNTGKIEDYLQFKGVFDSGNRCLNEKEEETSKDLNKNQQLKERDRLS